TYHTLLATRLHRSGFSRGFESVDTGHEIVPLSLGWEPVCTVRAGVALRALSAIRAISARIALGTLVALRALRAFCTLRDAEIQHSRRVGATVYHSRINASVQSGRGTNRHRRRIASRTLGTLRPFWALLSLSVASLLDPVQLGGSDRRAPALAILPVIRLERHQFPPPG